LLVFLLSCQRIETGETISKDLIEYIQNMHLLEKDEKIIRFYSSYRKKLSGNFFTDKRMASYWIDENDSTKNKKEFAFYQDIVSLDTNYMKPSLTMTAYIMVTTSNGEKFKVYVDGKHDEIKEFFETAIAKWKSEKK
jgi:hypothetical protein